MTKPTDSARILIVDDDAAVVWALEQVISSAGYATATAAHAGAAMRLIQQQTIDVVITDIRTPGMDGLTMLRRLQQSHPHLPVIISTAHGTLETAIAAVRDGAFDYLPKPLDQERTLTVIRRALGEDTLAASATPTSSMQPDGMLGASPIMQDLFRRIAAAAATDLDILITGAAGTGKQVVADALHHHGARANAAYVTLDCASLTDDQAEAKLWHPHDGLIAQALGGTILIDEVAELSSNQQSRFIQYLQKRPLDGPRLLATSNRDLAKLIASGDFREELWYLLKGVHLHVPTLRERLDDLPLFVRHNLAELARRLGRPLSITDAAMSALRQHPWPGNVRELRQRLAEAAVLATGGVLAEIHLNLPNSHVDDASASTALSTATAARVEHHRRLHPGSIHARIIDEVEATMLRTILASTEGNQLRAAELLGINRITLKKRMDVLGIGKASPDS